MKQQCNNLLWVRDWFSIALCWWFFPASPDLLWGDERLCPRATSEETTSTCLSSCELQSRRSPALLYGAARTSFGQRLIVNWEEERRNCISMPGQRELLRNLTKQRHTSLKSKEKVNGTKTTWLLIFIFSKYDCWSAHVMEVNRIWTGNNYKQRGLRLGFRVQMTGLTRYLLYIYI